MAVSNTEAYIPNDYPIKRYLLFCMHNYYPTGGWNDFSDSFDTLELAVEAGKRSYGDYWHVVDTAKGDFIVERGDTVK
jgi:hypothetical protein